MSFFLSLFVVVIAFLASLTVYAQGRSDIYLRIFPIYLFLLSIVLGISSYLAYRDVHNTLPFNILTILQYCFYFFVLYRVIQNKILRRVALQFVWIYPLASGLNILFFQKLNIHTITYAFGALLIVAFCIFYFFELFQRPQSVTLSRNPDFWVCSGLLFYFSCSFPIYGMANNLSKMPGFIIRNLISILNVLDILLYISLVIAFICRLKIRKFS
jgi:hypothetical protein